MILKGYKEKSNQKFINKLVGSRQAALSSKPIQYIGIILNLSEFDDFEAFRAFFKTLNVQEKNIKIVGFVNDPKLIESSPELLFSKKQLGWKGKIKDNQLNDFLKTEFDALLSYYKDDGFELNLVTALSKANFKIGLSDKDERLNDLILNIHPKDFKLFKEELIRYLTILNKI